jgi:hypothetical protein
MKKLIFIFLVLTNLIFAQKDSKFEKLLLENFPTSSTMDGRWVYYPETGNIQEVYKPAIKEKIPEFQFYKIHLTNFLGYHIDDSDCLILYNSKESKIILVEPIWYSDLSENFLKLFINNEFKNSDEIKVFVQQLQELIMIGSTILIDDFIIDNQKINFNLVNSNTKKEKDIWRNIEIGIKNNTIEYFESTNPKINRVILIK